jgi:hypothetical protein
LQLQRELRAERDGGAAMLNDAAQGARGQIIRHPWLQLRAVLGE